MNKNKFKRIEVIQVMSFEQTKIKLEINKKNVQKISKYLEIKNIFVLNDNRAYQNLWGTGKADIERNLEF